MLFIHIWYKSELKKSTTIVFLPVSDTSYIYIYKSSSYLDQDILAEAREGIFKAIKADVVPLT